MSNTFRPKKKAEPKKEPQKRDGKLLTNDNRVKFLLGVFLIFFTFFLAISFFSYLFTGDADQDVVQNSLRAASGKAGKSTDNILGLIGAKISHWLQSMINIDFLTFVQSTFCAMISYH